MWFLFLQIWIWLLAAFVLGWFAHWFLCCRGKGNSSEETDSNSQSPAYLINTDAQMSEDASVNVPDAIQSNWKPPLFTTPPDSIDDLKQIKGVGGVLQEKLNELGVYQFQQIAEWTDEHVAWMNDFLSFSGRIDREQWREQAQILAGGGKTDFSQRVQKGDVEY